MTREPDVPTQSAGRRGRGAGLAGRRARDGATRQVPGQHRLAGTEPERTPVRVVEVSVNPGLYERGHIPGAASVSWHTDAGRHRQPRHRAARAVPGAAGARRHRRRYHHDPVRRQQQLVRGLGRLGVRHLRHPERKAAGRPQEMGGRGPAAGQQRHRARAGQRPRQGRQPALRARLQDVLAVGPACWSISARPTNTTARSSRPTAC